VPRPELILLLLGLLDHLDSYQGRSSTGHWNRTDTTMAAVAWSCPGSGPYRLRVMNRVACGLSGVSIKVDLVDLRSRLESS
jgi:hypothetical protein